MFCLDINLRYSNLNFLNKKIMNVFKKIALVITVIAMFASCQSKPDVNKILANSETRKELIDSIAANSKMSNEMMEALMNRKNGNMMQEYHQKMMKMMKDNPEMKKNMMEMSKSDSSMVCPMCGKMMGNDHMMDTMKKMHN